VIDGRDSRHNVAVLVLGSHHYVVYHHSVCPVCVFVCVGVCDDDRYSPIGKEPSCSVSVSVSVSVHCSFFRATNTDRETHTRPRQRETHIHRLKAQRDTNRHTAQTERAHKQTHGTDREHTNRHTAQT
jgi:hypothetical protein